MKRATSIRLKALLDRISRLSTSEDWSNSLNPTQRAVLSYLASANQFSRAPSNIAEYMCTTRGTTSQTLKALERKGLVCQFQSSADKRSISFDITTEGMEVLSKDSRLDATLRTIDQEEGVELSRSLESIAHQLLAQRGYKAFGICSECKYHSKSAKGRYCALLEVPLTTRQSGELCHEHVPK